MDKNLVGKSLTRWMLLLFLTAFVNYAQAQGVTPKEWADMQRSGNYLIGMGMGTSIENARQIAVNDLAGKISTKVEAQFDFVINQKTEGKDIQSSSTMDKIVKSYSSVKLNNLSEYTVKDKDGSIIVYRYIKNSDLRAMFKKRIGMAKKWAKDAADREKCGKVGDALQDYYWALALLRSCPDGDLETIDTEEGPQNMIQYVYAQVKSILGNVSVKATNVEQIESDAYGQRVTLAVTYKGKPAVNFNYKYHDGKSLSAAYTCKDGNGELLLPAGTKLNKLKIHAEYECREEANIHPELQCVMEETDPVPFQAAIITVDTKNCAKATMQSSSLAYAAIETSAYTTLTAEEAHPYIATMQSIEKGIADYDYAALNSHFTSEGWEMFQKLINYGSAKLLRAPEVQFLRSNGQVVCRSFPMSFTFKGNRRTFTEDVVFYLNQEGKVTEVAFGLEQAAVTDIMQRGDWSEDARQVMVHFLETYKTAYALKRWDYINSIFSNEALIITGSVVKGTGKKELGPTKMQHVKYTRLTKEQYMKNLQKCFSSNEYINIHFADNIVRRSHTKPDIYGIQIKQDYFSSSYGDTGYLFLLIDFTKPEAPVIHVRTWQPDNDPNVRDGRIGIADFLL